MNRIVACVCALGFIAFAPCLPVRAAGTNEALRSALRAQLAHYLATRAKPEHISAVSLSVSLPGLASPISVAVGTTQIGGGIAVTPRSLYEIGSNTKAFTSAMMLQLEAEGKLSIDQTVGRYLPQYPAYKNVTLRRLLDMTSMIPTYDGVPAMLAAYARNPMKSWTPKELIAYVYPHIGSKPGWLYSNTAYLMSQLIIERVTGHPYRDELRSRILQNPALGLSSTYYDPSFYPPAVSDRMVSGYFASTDADNAPLAPLLYKDMKPLSNSWTQAAGGIVASPEDVVRWVRALYQGPVLAAKERSEMESIVSLTTGKPIASTSASNPRGFGLGIAQATKPELGRFWYYEGETLGYRVVYAYLPKANVVFAFGLNSQPTEKDDKGGMLADAIFTVLKKAGRI